MNTRKYVHFLNLRKKHKKGKNTIKYERQEGDTTMLVEISFDGTKTPEEAFEDIIMSRFRERFNSLSN